MKRTIKMVVEVVKLGSIAGVIAFLLAFYALPNVFSGEEVFNSEEEYAEFKQALVEPDVSYDTDDMFVMSSAPPIIVRFIVTVPDGYVFPYGEKNNVLHGAIIAGSVFGGMVMAFRYIVFLFE